MMTWKEMEQSEEKHMEGDGTHGDEHASSGIEDISDQFTAVRLHQV